MSRLVKLLNGSALNSNAKQNLVNDIKENAENLQDFFDIVSKHYDTKGTKLGKVTKAVLVNNIDTLLAASGAKPKQ